MIEKPCRHCGTAVDIKAYRANTFKYCSRRCAALAARSVVVAECGECGKKFEHISARCNKAKYCGRRCYHRAQRRLGSVAHVCRHCKKRFRDNPSKKRIYCSRACSGKEAKKTWRAAYTTVRKNMQRRGLLDKCNRCGYSDVPAILGVHHKDRDRTNNTPENLEVLCPNCHSLEHNKHVPAGPKD